jgi:hypothetical protein
MQAVVKKKIVRPILDAHGGRATLLRLDMEIIFGETLAETKILR